MIIFCDEDDFFKAYESYNKNGQSMIKMQKRVGHNKLKERGVYDVKKENAYMKKNSKNK